MKTLLFHFHNPYVKRAFQQNGPSLWKALAPKPFEIQTWDWSRLKDFSKTFENVSIKKSFNHFCPRRTVFVGDYEVACLQQSVGLLVCVSRTFSYLLIQTSEVHETLPVLFLCQWELVYQFSEKFINFYYPLPIIFVVIFSWDLSGLHRQRVVKVCEFFFNLVYKQKVVNKQPLQNSN